MEYSHILWDFNGTILNDVEAGINSANKLLSRRNMTLIENRDQYHDVFGFPIKAYYQRLGFDFEKESYESLAVEWVHLYLEFVKESQLQEGVLEALEFFQDKKIRQTILSATETSMLERQVINLGIEHFFDELLGLDNIHAHSKVSVGKEWITNNRSAKALFIGDTVHDYEVASEIGIDCVLIAKGHQNRKTLEACGVPVFDQVNEFLASLWCNDL
mgnify:CR=1 FL=1